MITWPQYRQAEYLRLRSDYPDATIADCKELAGDGTRRTAWTDATTLAMRDGTPTKRQWKSLLRDLGAQHIMRRVFHDAPDSCRRYVDAGLMLVTSK